jgi:hypothetical protein
MAGCALRGDDRAADQLRRVKNAVTIYSHTSVDLVLLNRIKSSSA